MKVDRNILVKYINLEKEIYHLEAKNVLKALKVKEGELSDLKNRVLELEKKHNESVKRTYVLSFSICEIILCYQ